MSQALIRHQHFPLLSNTGASTGAGTDYPVGLTLDQLSSVYWSTKELRCDANFQVNTIIFDDEDGPKSLNNDFGDTVNNQKDLIAASFGNFEFNIVNSAARYADITVDWLEGATGTTRSKDQYVLSGGLYYVQLYVDIVAHNDPDDIGLLSTINTDSEGQVSLMTLHGPGSAWTKDIPLYSYGGLGASYNGTIDLYTDGF